MRSKTIAETGELLATPEGWLTMEQLSDEWFEARRGRVTGSTVAKIMTGGNKAWDTMLDKLQNEIDTPEVLLGTKQIDAAPLRHGRKYEPIALANYELSRDIETRAFGFIINENFPGCGYSPDNVWDSLDHLIEIKCPYNTNNHAMTVVHGKGAEDYRAQMQFGMALMDIDICDFISFDKRYPDPKDRLFVIPVEKDMKYIEEMMNKVDDFLAMLESGARFANPAKVEAAGGSPSFF